MFSMLISCRPLMVIVAGLVVGTACNSSSNPVSPSTTTSATTSSTTSGTGGVVVTVNPNPVPFSGKPITDVAGCERRNNTWYYEQVLEETGGVAVTFTTEVDAFDGFVVNSNTVNIAVPARGKITLNPRWCSATAEKHTAQSTFMGVDARGNPITVKGPMVNLMAP
jgi:hypothetical protein